MKKYYYIVKVRSRMKCGCFPIDMLRYDGLIPYSSKDSQAIENSIQNHDNVDENDKPITIWLTRHAGRGWRSTTARWDSFSWIVVDEYESH